MTVSRFKVAILYLSVFLFGTSSFTGIFSVYADEESCFVPLESDIKVLEKALEECEERIATIDEVLADEERDQKRIRGELRSVEESIVAISFRISSNSAQIVILNDEIASIEEEITILQNKEQAASEGEVDLETLQDRLEEKQKALDDILEQQGVFIKRLGDLTEEKEELSEQLSALGEIDAFARVSAYENMAAAIRGKLLGLRGGAALSFEQALRYAEQASEVTGVRPAFLLGVIRTESRLGHNIGWANYLDAPMHPTRDMPVFPFITDTLGYVAEEVPVSQSPGWGWGGAMGPAQFIPSTWVCFGGFVNEKTNTCFPTGGVVRANKMLSVGSSGPDVRRLQEFLNANGFTVAESGPGSPGNETNEYTHAVGQAVIKFQDKYSARILRQYGYTRGTGVVGPATRNAINQIDFYSGPWRYIEHRDVVKRIAQSDFISDPWSPRAAFFASALYLQYLGAAEDECKAARRYYAGDWWYSNVALGYCRSVVSSARSFEQNIADFKKGILSYDG